MHACQACGAPLAPSARFCPGCARPTGFAASTPLGGASPASAAAAPFGGAGAPLGAAAPQAAMPLAGDALRICPGCGVIAPLQRTACVRCQTAFGATPLLAAGRLGSALWACISECDFQCRGCGLRSPLGSIDVDGEIECRRCGLVQVFDGAQWKNALAQAHAIADLAGPNPEGRNAVPGPSIAARNPHARVGLEHTACEHRQQTTIFDASGMRQLTLRTVSCPGHPLCSSCRTPLDVQIDGRGGASTSCPRCAERVSYAVSATVAASYEPLRAVLAEEYRTDRPAVRVARDGEAVALRCPSCGAALNVTRAGELVTCAYCKTGARVPLRAWCRVSGEAARFEPFWVLFDGPSPMRAKLARGKSPDDDDDDDDDDDGRDADERANGTSAAAPVRAEAIVAEAHRRVRNTQRTVWILIGAIVAVGILATVVVTVLMTAGVFDDTPAARPRPPRRR